MRTSAGWAGSLGTLALLWTCSAHAHISLEQGGTHLSRSGDSALKTEPCGAAGSTRGTNIYTYAPGQTITVTVSESIPHPSYFRIAFDSDGDDSFADPTSILPIDPNRGCPYSVGVTGDHCTMSDFYNNDTVLPGMDNLNPHVSAAAGTKYTWEVTLPDIECDNCTLQVIQVMEDPLGHGPFDNVSDIYHQCIDLVLKAGAATGGAGAGAGEGGAGGLVVGTAGSGSGEAGGGTAGGVGLGGAAGQGGGVAGTTGSAGLGDSGAGGAGVGAAPAGNASGTDRVNDDGCSVAFAGSTKTTKAGALPAFGLLLGALALRLRRRSAR